VVLAGRPLDRDRRLPRPVGSILHGDLLGQLIVDVASARFP
jgi:hypothetical protein